MLHKLNLQILVFFKVAVSKEVAIAFKELDAKGHFNRSGGGITFNSTSTGKYHYVNIDGRDDATTYPQIKNATAITEENYR